MKKRYDAIVVGIGAMGSAALYHLAKRGKRCLGLERFDIPHDRGSSHGITRIIRLAYFEHPSYVPLLRRAYELWRGLEAQADANLLHITGSIDAGPAGGNVFEGSRRSCEIHGLPHEIFTSAQLMKRFPGYRLPAGTMALLQPEGGFLVPEACVSAHVMQAQGSGAEVRANEKVLRWEPLKDGVEVVTEAGGYTADRLILSTGPWISEFVPQLKEKAVPERQVLGWFEPARPEWFRPESFPVFNLQVEEGHYYGFPVFGVPGFKIGLYHHRKERVNPDGIDRECHAEDERVLRACGEKCFPDGCGPVLSMRTCMFTNTPDEHFVIDVLPGYPQVVVASPCSGHGFKFSSVVGEILAELASTGETRHEIAWLRLQRLLVPSTPA